MRRPSDVQVHGVQASWAGRSIYRNCVLIRASATGLSALGPNREAVVRLTWAELADAVMTCRGHLTEEELSTVIRAAGILRRKSEELKGNAKYELRGERA